MGNLVLASSSPRRLEILKNLGLEFEIIPSEVDESIDQSKPELLVCELARLKATDVSSRIDGDDIVIGADTIVCMGDEVLGKPKSEESAFDMLKKLSGNQHRVITGICVVDKMHGKTCVDYEETIVYFKELSDEEIRLYIDSREPMDKAGAYGIQGLGGLFVRKIDGCYFNVVGLPIYKLNILLGKLGVNILEEGVHNEQQKPFY